MENRSSIFSFKTFRGPVNWTWAAPVALSVCIVGRLALEPLRDISDYDNADFGRFVAAEKYQVKEAPETGAVLLLGSSRTQYGISREVLAGELEVGFEEVRNASVPDGNPWTGLVMLKRNPGIIAGAKVVVVDLAPIQFNGSYMPLKNRFAHLATLEERFDLAGNKLRGEFVLDWFTGHVGIRRSLRSYGLAVLNGRRSTVWGYDDRERLEPIWLRQTDHEKLRDDLFAENGQWRPTSYAGETFSEFFLSPFIVRALDDLESLGRRYKVPLVLHQPPFHPEFMAAIRGNALWLEQYTEYRNLVLERSSEEVLVLFWEGLEELEIAPDEILDYGHFGRTAAETYSHKLGKRIREWLGSGQ